MKTQKTTIRDQFSPRQRFNWGFHDATMDVIDLGTVRALVMGGEQSPTVVSYTHDADYFRGYEQGRNAARKLGYRPESSQEAWDMLVEFRVYDNSEKFVY